mmetsp:Transcript_25405/g.83332  ORF Transcript_25405/g.83332 Transcript_25405/m.83332 type:complete len:212 (-) Transcript_25405:233-868(-)
MRRHHGSPPDATAAGRRLRGGGRGAVRRVGGGGAGVCRRAAGPLAWHGRVAAEHSPRVRHPAGSVAARVRPRSRRCVWPRLQPQPALLPPARPAPPEGAQPVLCRRLRAARQRRAAGHVRRQAGERGHRARCVRRVRDAAAVSPFSATTGTTPAGRHGRSPQRGRSWLRRAGPPATSPPLRAAAVLERARLLRERSAVGSVAWRLPGLSSP